jgi:hypothetical protein
MPDPFEILRSYAEAPAVTPQDYYRAGAAQVTGAGQDVEDQRTRDMRTMNPYDLIMKYGAQGVQMNSGIADGAQDYMIDRDRVRSNWEATNDTVVDVARGLVNGVGGLAALGTSVVSPEGGAYLSGKLDEFNRFSDEEQSAGLNSRREASGVVRELNASDTRRQYDREIGEGADPTIARFREIGRNVLNEGASAISDPMQFGSGVSQGVGSLFAGGLISKALTGGSALLGATGRTAALIEKAAMPAAIGGLEGGGAYTGTVNEIMGMTHAQLMENSPAYRRQIVEGVSQDDARLAVANEAGQMAAAIQAPVGVATGALVSKFEGAPFRVGSLRGAAGNIGRETVEESVQSGSGQLAQNFAIQQRADDTRELTQDLGEGIAQGGLYGMGTAGVLQTPGVAARTAVETTKLAGMAVMYGVNRAVGAFNARVEGKLAEVEAESPVSAEAMTAVQEEQAAQAPATAEAVKAALSETDLAGPELGSANEYVDRLMSAAQFDPAEIQTQRSPLIAGALEGATNRFDALRRVAAVAADTNVPGMGRISAGLYLIDQLRTYDNLLGSQLRETLDNTLDTHPSMDKLREFEAVVATIQSHPEIKTAIISALDVEAQINAEQVSDEAINTPDGQEAAQAVAGIAEAAVTQLDDPKLSKVDLLDKVDPAVNDIVLSHAYLGKIILTPSQVQALELTSMMARERQKAKEQAESWGLSKIQYVSNQIRSDRDDEKMPSAVKHTMTVLRALRAGNRTEAVEHMRNFLDFAQSMQNKLTAINEALANGNTSKSNPSKYMALDPSTGDFFEAEGVWVDPKNPATIKFAQEVSLDAQTVVVLANNLNLQTKMSLPQVEMVQLDPVLQEMADVITKQARKAKTTPEQRAQARAAELDAAVAEKKAQEPAQEVAPAQAKPVEKVEAEPDSYRDGDYTSEMSDEDLGVEKPKTRTDLEADPRTPAFLRISRSVSEKEKVSDPKDWTPAMRKAYDSGNTAEFSRLRGYTQQEIAEYTEYLKQADALIEDYGVDLVQALSIDDLIENPLPAKEAVSADRQETADEPVKEKAPEPDQQGVVPNTDAPVFEGRFEKLATVRGLNWMQRAFTDKKEASTRLVGVASPMAAIRAALKSQTALSGFVDGKVTHDYTGALSKAYSAFLSLGDKVSQTVRDRVSAELRKPIGKGGEMVGKVIMDETTKGESSLTDTAGAPNRWVRGKIFNLLNVVDNKLVLNDELLEAATLAALQWALAGNTRSSELTDEEIGEIVGMDPALVSDAERGFFNNGMAANDAILALSNKIIQFWGVEKNNKTPMGYTDGIPQAVAAEMLYGLKEAGLIIIDDATIANPNAGQLDAEGNVIPPVKTFNRIQFAEFDGREALEEFPNAIETAVMLVPDQVSFIGSPPTSVSPTQMRNKMVKNTPQQLKMIEKAQKTPYLPDMQMVDIYLGLGKEGVLELFGAGADLAAQLLNKNHRRSLEGKNRTIAAAYDRIQAVMKEVTNRAGVDGKEPGDMEIFYEHNVSRVGRLHMEGLHNPQANKLTREAFLPTWSTLDLTDRKNKDLFYLAVGQAWGVKVHKQSLAETRKDVQKMMGKPEVAAALKLLREWLEGGFDFSEDDLAILKAGLPSLSPHSLHAGVEMAKYQMADAGQRAEFRTSLYVEADGVTDGPINALVHMAPGSFSPDWLKAVGKGGLFFGQSGMTMDEYTDKVDLYGSTQTNLNAHLERQKKEFNKPNLKAQSDAMFRVMEHLLGSKAVMFDESTGEITIDRGVVKNPLTVTIYGSGKKGIASKVTESLLGAFYAEQSRLAQLTTTMPGEAAALEIFGSKATENPTQAKAMYEQYVSDLQTLTNIVLIKGKSGPYTEDRTSKTKKWDNDYVEFTFSPDQLENLQQNVESIFVDPLDRAIKNVIGEINNTTVTLRRAIQAQSIVMKYAFQREIERRLEKKKETDPDYRQGDFLSQAELNEVYASLKHLSPLIHTANQSFLIGSSERATIPGAVWARSVDGTLSSEVSVYGPTNAGVSGIPVMIIGPGDGQMIQNGSVDPEMPDEKMFVFDGVNFSLSTIEKGSELMNKAVHSGWLENPLGDVARTFDAFMEDADLTNMSERQMKELANALFSRKEAEAFFKGGIAPNAVIGMLADEMGYVRNDLNRLSQQTKARAEVLAEVQVTVDHMASAAKAYVSEGRVLDGMSEEAILEYLNARFNEKLSVIRKEENIQENIFSDLESVGVTHTRSKTRVISTDQLTGLVDQMKIPADQKSMMIPTLRALKSKGYTVVFGSPAGASSYAVQNNLRRIDSRQSAEQQTQGFIVFGDKTIYLHTPSSETLLHELIHAATLEKVAAFYTQPETLSAADRDAVARIEGLMQEWLLSEDNLIELAPQVRRSFDSAKQAVEGHLNNITGLSAMNKAAALNEFMAWNLSNSDLIRINKRTNVKSQLFRVIGDALVALKKLIWGESKAPFVDKSIYSNLAFNTAILMSSTRTVRAELSDTVLYQSNAFGRDDRLTKLRAQFDNKVAVLINEVADPIQKDTAKNAVSAAVQKAADVTASFQSHGFPMTMQEASTFQSMVAAFMADAELNPVTLNSLQKIYTNVMEQLSVETFMKDPQGTDPADRFQAQEKFNSLAGDFGLEYDSAGRSTLLPAFLALANTNNTFRAVLADIKMPKTGLEKWNTVDNVLTNVGVLTMDRLASTMAGADRKATRVTAAIDALTNVLAQSAEDQKSFVVQKGLYKISGAVNAANDYLVKNVQDFSSKAIDVLTDVQNTSSNKVVKDAAAVGKVIASVVNIERSDSVAAGLMSMLNQGRIWKPLHDLVNEFVGSTDENWDITSMVKSVKTVVQQARQQFREQLPEIIAEKFSRELADNEWTEMFISFGRTDLASLKSSLSTQEILRLVSDNNALLAEISRIEGRIQGSDPKRWATLQRKSDELAQFMMHGKVSGNLLRNAYAVARLFGEAGVIKTGDPDPRLVSDIDQLVSLYALNLTEQSTKDAMAKLVENEAEGLDFTLSYLVGQRLDEQVKISTLEAKLNHYKGYIPTDNAQGLSLIVADDAEFSGLRLKGFKRVGDYAGSVAEGPLHKKGYYFAPVSGLSTYNQGIVQNVRPTASGVDPVTGFTYGTKMVAGRIVDPIHVKKITLRRSLNEKATEPLMPIFGSNGEVVAYERSIDAKQEIRLEKNTHLGEMIGAWRGRQAEEAMAGAFNQVLIERLKKMYDIDVKAGRGGEYIDLYDKKSLKDPVLEEAVTLMTRETRQFIKQTFGGSTFMVRKDMLNDVVGYRQASIGDMWTGNSRISEEAQKSIRRAAIGVFGADAYQKMVNAEKFHQNVISAARILIVVKSVVVPVSNVISNIYQLTARGVPLIDTLKKLPAKTAEVDQYVKNRLRQIEVEAELRAATGDLVKTRKLSTELQGINDANRRMSIWPLIEAGEFSSISEGGITHDELALAEGRLTDYIEGLTEKLPEAIKTAGKYALITKDTALFKGLARAIEYGDFLAKAVLYDDLTIRQKLTHDQAIRGVTEEFINYDRLPGRGRGYLESMGILWFWNFKIRATKVAISMVRHNPLQTLLATVAPTPPMFGSVGLPVSDNIFSITAEGALGNSVGLGQAFRAPFLNPWVQITT